MPLPEPYLIFTRRLNTLGLRYMVTGSTAAIYYGEPRMTNDVDIVLSIRREDAARFVRAFPPEEFYCPPDEVIGIEIARECMGHFNLIHHETGFKADIYVMAGDPLHKWGMENVRVVEFSGESLRMAPPEYVIVRKLQFFREGGSDKHLRDIVRMLDSLGPGWDRGDLNKWVDRQGLKAEWAAAQDG
jgi:hypothetical protein